MATETIVLLLYCIVRFNYRAWLPIPLATANTKNSNSYSLYTCTHVIIHVHVYVHVPESSLVRILYYNS